MTTDERIDKLTSILEEGFSRLEAHFNEGEVHFSRLEGRFNQVEARFKEVEARFNRLEDYILKFRGEAIRRFDIIDQRLDYLSSAVANIDVRFPPMSKAILDFGTLAGQLTREHSGIVDASHDLTARVGRLEEKTSRLIDPAA